MPDVCDRHLILAGAFYILSLFSANIRLTQQRSTL